MGHVVRMVLAVSLFGAVGCQQAYRPLFNGRDLSGWTETGSHGAWSVADGVLKCSGQRDAYAWLATDRHYRDFILRLEWRVGEKANSGVFCRVPKDRDVRASMEGFEIQIIDDRDLKLGDEICGSIFQRRNATARAARPLGEWNAYEITCDRRHVRVVCNGVVVNEFDMDSIESMRNVPAEGFIGLQNHGTPVEFRNICIRELTPAEKAAS